MDQDTCFRRHNPDAGIWTVGQTIGLVLLLLTGCASGDRPPTLIGGQEVIYPAVARAQQIEGEVVVGYDVTETGNVENVIVLSAQPPAVFDEAAIETVRSWRFQPRREGGRTVPTPGRRSKLTFKLDSKDPYQGVMKGPDE